VTGIGRTRSVAQVNRESYIGDVRADELAAVVRSGRLSARASWDVAALLDALIICVPTPFNANREPDLSFVCGATEAMAPRLRAGQLVVLESTTYPGTTEEVLLPILERGGLRVGQDFSLAYSPERVDPEPGVPRRDHAEAWGRRGVHVRPPPPEKAVIKSCLSPAAEIEAAENTSGTNIAP
jgi:UDP-N-acetyl-D-glucosamine dehydrogenase